MPQQVPDRRLDIFTRRRSKGGAKEAFRPQIVQGELRDQIDMQDWPIERASRYGGDVCCRAVRVCFNELGKARGQAERLGDGLMPSGLA